jgi:hypothetical protein
MINIFFIVSACFLPLTLINLYFLNKEHKELEKVTTAIKVICSLSVGLNIIFTTLGCISIGPDVPLRKGLILLLGIYALYYL